MTERRYAYATCDVFTTTRFGGNPLAVLTDARGLSGTEMQAIAREFNFSETTFVLPPQDPRHTAQLRIFTPGYEMKFAGHPTVGSAFVLAALGLVDRGVDTIVFEEGVGPVPVRIERAGSAVTRCTLSVAQLPQRGPAPPARADLARMLGLPPAALDGDGESWSCGMPFSMVPLVSVEALQSAQLDLAAWREVMAGYDRKALYPVARVDAHNWRVRMFAPDAGVMEDPATGSAAASFAGWLNHHGHLADGTTRVTLHQGQEVQRPSTLHLEVDRSRGAITAVRVGGASVLVGEGTLRV
jgi:trans-2,3-dihydro-3-hydroxyanthranilate isomerase